jgi:hypothetical protein
MSIYQKASLVQIPSGYKAADDKLYSVVPSNGDGDFTVTVDADATRVNKDGLIESVVADQARLNYDPTNPQDPHLLLEPSRTNECLYSKTLSSWSELSGGSLQTITDNDAVAPDGSLTASTITFTGTGTSLLRQFTNKAYTTNKHSSSFYAKKISGNGSVFFGITDTETEFTPTDKWVRYEVNDVTPSDFGTNLFLDLNFDCSAGDKIAVWGMQLEEGTYSTSIIPTSGSAVTRTADFVSGGGDANLFNDSEGTLFVEARSLDSSDTSPRGINISSGNNESRVLIQWQGNTLYFVILKVYANQTVISTTAYDTEEYLKIGFRYKENDVAVYVNGNLVDKDANASMFSDGTLTTLDFGIGLLGSDYYFNGNVKQLMYFDTALSDSELQTLTS